ncbi:response regulator transcription factor [Arthrobacter sp.]|uniref:response regulator transcription factor n=1 Tax=Arthrobacter sp. TaxID=1667 RepID=UPI003A93F062
MDQSAEYAELVSILTGAGPGGALVLGGAGMGKTSLVQAALARTDVPVPALRLHCTPTLSAMPYGALSPYLSTLERIEEPVQVLREINVILEGAREGGVIPIVLVEDAHFLDPESSFVLSLLVENAAVKVIAIGAGRIEGDSTLFSLTESGLLSTLVVQPFDADGVRFLAQEITAGVLTEGAVEAIQAMTGGNPSFIKAFVQSCLDQGVLVRAQETKPSAGEAGGRWLLARLAPEPDEGLVELVREMHSSLTPGQQRIVEIMALGGRQPRALLLANNGADYRHLVESGILKADREGMIELRAEIHAMVLRHAIAPGHRAELHQQWIGHQQELGLEPTPLQVLWGVEVGAVVPAEEVMSAVATANDQMDYALAWKLCALAGISSDSDLGVLLEARTLLGMGRYYSARAILVGLMEKTDDPVILQRALNMLYAITVYLGLDEGELERLENLWEKHARHGSDRRGFAQARAEHQAINELLESWRDIQQSDPGPQAMERIEGLLADPALPVEGRTIALLVLSDLHSVDGRTETALGLARKAMPQLDLDARLAGNYQLSVLTRIGWNLVFSGRYAEAEEFLAAHRGSTVRLMIHRHGSLSLIRGISHLLRGQTNLARHALLEATAEFQVNDPAGLAPLAQALGEFADQRAASVLSANSRTRSERGSKIDLKRGITRGAVSASLGMLSRAVATSTAAGASMASAYPLLEREFLAGTSQRALNGHQEAGGLGTRLFELARGMEGQRARFLARMADPDMMTDGPASEALAREAVEASEYQVAAESMARAATLYAEAGDTRRCGAVLRGLIGLVRERQLIPDAYVSRALALAELTSREEEIVELARGGNNNAEIARKLTVSQRTVEGHLYRVFSKLGITDRSELNGLRLHAGTSRGQNA